MIQQIYITDYLSDAAAQPVPMIQSVLEQCPALLTAQWQVGLLPPVNTLFNVLCENDAPAQTPVAAVLAARQGWPAARPTFCLLPVHLGMRRDTFSLQHVVALGTDVYGALTERLQTHFAEDFILHTDASQHFWWVQPLRETQAQCQWPQDCLYQQAFHWQPQGPEASVVRQWMNEIQMLLHQAAQTPSPVEWPAELNSLWFASVGDLPAWRTSLPVVAGQGEMFAGLQASQLPAIQPLTLPAQLADQKNHHALWVADRWQEVDWPALSTALQKGHVRELKLILPFAERSVTVHYKKQLRWQFWRKLPTLESLLQQLESALTLNTK